MIERVCSRRYHQLFRPHNNVQLLPGHFAAYKQALVEEACDATADHSILSHTVPLYTVGLVRGLRLPEMDRGGTDTAEPLHDRSVQRFLLQGIHQEAEKQQERRRDGRFEREVEESIAAFHVLEPRTFQRLAPFPARKA